MSEWFNPSELMLLAKKLVEDVDYSPESRYRTAVNRAYWSAFLAAYVMLLKRGKSFPNVGRIHKDVRLAVQDELPKIGNKLEKLHEDFRVPADYYVFQSIDKARAQESIRISEVIVASMEKM